MSLSPVEFLRAAVPRGLESLLPTDRDPLTKRLASKQRLRLGTVVIAAGAEKRLTPDEITGVMYFTQIVKTADDRIDRNPQDFTDPGELRRYLLQSEIEGTDGVSIAEGLRRCLEYFPTHKQTAITSFLDEMVMVHLGGPQRGIAGAYSFEDAQRYRRTTDDPLLETFAELTDSNKKRFVAIGRGWQLIEDGLDWAEDAKERAKNLFIGMATDIWHERGTPPREEVDYLNQTLAKWARGRIFDFRIREIMTIKSPHIRATRQRYKQETLAQLPAIGGNIAGVVGVMAHALF